MTRNKAGMGENEKEYLIREWLLHIFWTRQRSVLTLRSHVSRQRELPALSDFVQATYNPTR